MKNKVLVLTLAFLTGFASHANASLKYSCKTSLTENGQTRVLAMSETTSPSGNPTLFARTNSALVAAEMNENENSVKVTIHLDGKILEAITGFSGATDSATQILSIGLNNESGSIAGPFAGIGLECTRTKK